MLGNFNCLNMHQNLDSYKSFNNHSNNRYFGQYFSVVCFQSLWRFCHTNGVIIMVIFSMLPLESTVSRAVTTCLSKKQLACLSTTRSCMNYVNFTASKQIKLPKCIGKPQLCTLHCISTKFARWKHRKTENKLRRCLCALPILSAMLLSVPEVNDVYLPEQNG